MSDGKSGLQLRSLLKKSGELELSLVNIPTPEPADDELTAPEKLGKLTLTLDPGWHAGMVRKIFFTADGQQVITIAADHAIPRLRG